MLHSMRKTWNTKIAKQLSFDNPMKEIALGLALLLAALFVRSNIESARRQGAYFSEESEEVSDFCSEGCGVDETHLKSAYCG